MKKSEYEELGDSILLKIRRLASLSLGFIFMLSFKVFLIFMSIGICLIIAFICIFIVIILARSAIFIYPYINHEYYYYIFGIPAFFIWIRESAKIMMKSLVDVYFLKYK